MNGRLLRRREPQGRLGVTAGKAVFPDGVFYRDE